MYGGRTGRRNEKVKNRAAWTLTVATQLRSQCQPLRRKVGGELAWMESDVLILADPRNFQRNCLSFNSSLILSTPWYEVPVPLRKHICRQFTAKSNRGFVHIQTLAEETF